MDPVKILILEDNPADAELAEYALKSAGGNFIFRTVETEAEYRRELSEFHPDIIISDFDLPVYNGLEALRVARELKPDVPFILFTGAMQEERAIEILTGGATDYVMKNRLERLVPAVERALKEAGELKKRKEAEAERDVLIKELERRVEERTRDLREEINERRWAEGALQRSREQLAALLEQLPVGVGLLNREGVFTTFNSALAGVVPNRVAPSKDASQKGRWISYDAEGNLLPPEQFPGARALRGEFVSPGVEFQYTDDRGQVFSILVSAVPYQSAEGDEREVIVITQDVTGPKRAEDALRESEQVERERLAEMQAIFTAQNDAILVYDTRMNVRLANPSFPARYGFDPVGLNLRDIVERVSCRWLNGTPFRLEEQPTPRAIKGEQVTGAVYLVTRADGSEGIVETSSGPILLGDRVSGSVTVWHDITDRRQAEEEIRERERQLGALIGNVKSAVAFIDRTGRFTIVNPAFLRMFGLSETETIKNINDLDWGKWQVFEPDGTLLDVDEHPVRKAVMTGRAVRDKLVGVRLPSGGELVWMLISADPVFGPDGGIEHVVCTYHDITERKKAEMEAAAGQARLRMALEAADTVLWEWDITTGSILYSDNIREIVHGDRVDPYCSLDELMEQVHPEDRGRLAEALGRASGGGAPFECEYRVRMLDGAYRWILGKGRSVVMEAGRPVRVLGLSTDITGRKQTEAALQETEDRFRYALETSHTGAWILNLKDHTASRSLEHDRIFGYPELLPQWTYEIFLDHVLPEDRAVVDARFRQAVETRGEWNFDCRIRRSDGEVRWIWAAGSHRASTGGDPYLAGIVQDITERKKTEEAAREKEERHAVLWETMLQGVVHQDADGKIISMNPAAERILGKSPEEFLGETSTSVEHHTLREDGTPFPGLEHPSMVALRTGQQVRGVVMGVFNPREKAYRWVSIDAIPLFRPSEDSPFQVYTVFVDITGKKQAEEELIRHTKEIEAVNRELESFSYTVSHDLRAPLRAIDGFSRMLERDLGGRLDPEAARKLQVISRNSEKMGQLIDDLLKLSRTVRVEVHFKRLNIKPIVEDIWKELQAGNPDRDMEIAIGELPPAHGDLTLVRQVFSNLLDNAVKFTRDREKAVIEVTGVNSGECNTYCVRENGVGFDMSYYDKLFEIFRRLHSESQYEGTGVGLAIVKKIVERHGGRVWAESEPGRGAAFYFTLPAAGKAQGERAGKL